ncbi:MAG: DUF5666 domain-containing protein [Bryobacteraceae bacterium]
MRGLLVGFTFLICSAHGVAAQSAQGAQSDRIEATEGKLVAVHDHSITVRNDQGTRIFLIAAGTKIWRGDYVDVHQLRLGDDLSVRFRVSDRTGEATAVDIDANVDRWDGNITKVSGDRVEIEFIDEDGNPLGTKGTVIFWDRTTFLVDASRSDLRPGAFLEVIGLVESPDTMRAWRVIGFDPRGTRQRR